MVLVDIANISTRDTKTCFELNNRFSECAAYDADPLAALNTTTQNCQAC